MENNSRQFLLVDGYSWDCGNITKLTEITEEYKNFFLRFSDLIKKIKKKGKDNWSFETHLKIDKNSKDHWITVWNVYDMYPDIPNDIIDQFFEYVPNTATTITGISILSCNEIKKIL